MALRSRRASNSIGSLLSSAMMRGIQTFVNEGRGLGVQKPSETAADRTSGSGQDDGHGHDPVQSRRSKGKSRCSGYTILCIDRSILTAAASQGERLGRPDSGACYGCDRSREGTS